MFANTQPPQARRRSLDITVPPTTEEQYPHLESLYSPSRDISDVLHSNHDPGPVKYEEIRVNVQLAAAEFHNFTQAIQSLEQNLLRMKKAHMEDSETLRRYKHALSALRRLPNEILAQIFLLVVVDTPYSCRMNNGVWDLSQVCRRWRDVALSFSRLWPYAWIAIHGHSSKSALYNRVKLLLQRSKDQPLHVTIHLSKETLRRSLPAAHLLMNRSNQWQHATLTLLQDTMLLNRLRGIKNQLPILQSLEILGDNHPPPPIDFIGDAPLLREFKFAYFTCGRDETEVEPSTWEIPWAQLKKFTYEGDDSEADGDWVDFSEVLPQLTSLEELYILSSALLSAGAPVRMQALKTLVVHVVDGLDHLRLPAILHLSVRLDCDDDLWMLFGLFYNSLQCPLETLALNISPSALLFDDEDTYINIMEDILESLPALLKLDVHLPEGPIRAMIYQLAYDPIIDYLDEEIDEVRIFVPKLQSLTTRIHGHVQSKWRPGGWDWEDVNQRMIEMAMRRHYGLTQIQLPSATVTPALLQRIRTLERNDVKVIPGDSPDWIVQNGE